MDNFRPNQKLTYLMKKLLFAALALPLFGYGQFFENFDASEDIPAGWTVINNGSLGEWQIITYTGTLGTLSGNRSASIVYDSWDPHDDYLITPPITVTEGVSDFFSFWGRSRDPLYPEQISVLLSTTGTDESDFTTVLDPLVAPPSGAEYHNYTYDLTQYLGQTIYIAFYSQTYDKFVFDIENVEVKAIPTCPAPTNLTVSQVTTSSATIGWTSNSDATLFIIEYGPVGFTPGTGTMMEASVNPTTIEDLEPGTVYDVYVTAFCGTNDLSDPAGPKVVQTECLAVTAFPFFEGFEDDTFGTCWTNQAVSGPNVWQIVDSNQNGTITPRTGNGMAQFFTDNINQNVARLITPPLDLTAVESPQLTFYYANVNWVGDIDELRVYYRTAPGGEWTLLGTYTDEMTAWTEVNLELPNPTSTYSIAFESTSFWARGFDIDDITVDGALATPSLDANHFKYYPNPVADVLNLEYNESISKVEVYNMIGQLVVAKNVDASQAQINLSNLNAGTYVVKVFSGNQMNTLKVMKQ